MHTPSPSLPWKGPLSGLTKKLSKEPDWTWVSGGCFAFSQALFLVTGCPEYGIIEISSTKDGVENPGGVHHSMVKIGDGYYDYEGKVDVNKWMRGIKRSRLPHPVKLIVGSREDYDDYWFNDDWLSPSEQKILVSVLRSSLSELRF